MFAAQEERFTRIKNDASFPANAIKYCLESNHLAISDIDFFVFYEKPFLKFERLLETFMAYAPVGITSYLKALPLWIKEKIFMKRTLQKALELITPGFKLAKDKLLFSEHHLSHAASAFFASPYQDAAILTIDGVGEWTTTSIFKGSGNRIERLSEIRFPHSIGLLYSAFTYYLGFKVNCDEYKVMGLAPYGEPEFVELILENLIDIKPDGSFRLNMSFFNYATGLTMTNQRFAKLFGHLRREPSGPVEQFHMNIARSIQAVTEQVVLKIARHIKLSHSTENLCLAGGVALNCVVNGRLLKESGFNNIWVQPAAGDAGGALGAALHAHYSLSGQERKIPADGRDFMKQSLLGPEFSKGSIISILEREKLRYHLIDDEHFFIKLAHLINEGNVIGWFNGKMEFGPRALGCRSIIADPRKPDMQAVLNQKIKFRESFRPFAPAVLEKHAAEFFEPGVPSPYMLFTAQLKPEKKINTNESVIKPGFQRLQDIDSVVPAVTHVDGSARIQTVNAGYGDFYELICAFYELTGCPLVINTSFNIMDEPIVGSPEDAISCFRKTGMDVLAFKNILIYKHENN